MYMYTSIKDLLGKNSIKLSCIMTVMLCWFLDHSSAVVAAGTFDIYIIN